jgi:hypothetical protein
MWLTPIFNPIDIQLKCGNIIYNWFLLIKCVKALYVYIAQSFAISFTTKIWKFGEFLTIEMLTCDKFQVEQMASCCLLV